MIVVFWITLILDPVLLNQFAKKVYNQFFQTGKVVMCVCDQVLPSSTLNSELFTGINPSFKENVVWNDKLIKLLLQIEIGEFIRPKCKKV